ncbi:MAG TPA: hypothetical protein VKU00_24170 [Chthonomonadaceae bacterium]|nr:hypothetical protein [Chthonomonadaceae bacterium]
MKKSEESLPDPLGQELVIVNMVDDYALIPILYLIVNDEDARRKVILKRLDFQETEKEE